MKSYLVDVRLDGSLEHVVTGKRVTVPEIAFLRAIHGNDAVMNLRSVQEVEDYSEDEERERLSKTYDNRHHEEGPLLPRLFGLNGRLPLTLRDIGIDAKAAAREAEAAVKEAQKRAAELKAEAASEEAEDTAAEDAEAAAFS